MESSIASYLDQIDLLIKEGKISLARIYIHKINYKKINRNERFQLSNLCRRTGLVLKSIRVLNFNINTLKLNLNDQEICSYAAGLINIGVTTEALSLLKPLYKKNVPQALFHLGLLYIQNWDYRRAKTIFSKYIKTQKENKYQKFIGQLNLLSCLIVLKELEKSDILVEKLKKIALKNNYNFALDQLFRMKTQILIQQNKLLLAEQEILKSVKSDQISTVSDLINKKWYYIVKSHQEAQNQIEGLNYLSNLSELKQIAERFRHWETVRDCDFHIALITKNKLELEKIYKASSSVDYKKKIHESLSDLGFELNTMNVFPEIQIYLKLKKNNKINQLLNLLCIDQYKSFSIGEIFSILYPAEKFNPDSSVVKIYRIIQRTKNYIKNYHSDEFELKIIGNQCKLYNKTNKQVVLNYLQDYSFKNNSIYKDSFLEKIRKKYKGKLFSIKLIQIDFKLSASMAYKIINFYLQKKILTKAGNFNTGMYVFSNFR